MYAILDQKSELYCQPLLLNTEMQALRAFTNMANDTKTDIGRNPEDYSLWWIGDYEDTTAAIIPAPAKKCIGFAIDLRTQQDWLDPDQFDAFKDTVLGILMQADRGELTSD